MVFKNKKKFIKSIALEEGFDAVAITSPSPDPKDAQALSSFIKKKYNGEMNWMANNQTKRSNPLELMGNAKSIIVLGTNYSPLINSLENLKNPSHGSISSYAQTSDDYHNIIKKALKRVGRKIIHTFNTEIKIFVDTAPIMEKPLAARSGLGWQGKHTNLVSKSFGSWLFLGEIFTSLEIPPDLPQADHCGSCTACMNVCPTKAFPSPYQLDSRKCISYLTIEHRGLIEPDLMAAMGNRIYGCDDCLAVCPWNKFAKPTNHPQLAPRIELIRPSLEDLAQLTEKDFREFFSKSPIKRTGRNRFIRNILIGIGNSKDTSLIDIVKQLTRDKSLIVSKTAQWALTRLNQIKIHPAKKSLN